MRANVEQVKKDDSPLHRAIISDIVLWVILALALALGIYWFAIRMPEMNGQTILLKFRDANQITRGSAVTMLGTDVGFVKNIQIHNDHVDVMVQTFSKSLSITSGATFTVLFNGLAGSKSIDIEVPKTPMPEIDGKPIYIVAEPIRLKTLLDYMVDMTQALTVGAENITDFFGKRKPVEELQFNIHQAHEWTQASLQGMGQSLDKMRELRQELEQATERGVQTAGRFNRRSVWLIEKTDPRLNRPKVESVLQSVQNIRRAFVPASPGGQPPLTIHLGSWKRIQEGLNPKLTQFTRRVNAGSLDQILTRIESGEDRFIDFLDQAQAFFQCHGKCQFQQFRQNIQAFNRQVLALNLKLESRQGNAVPQQPYTPCCPPLSPPQTAPQKSTHRPPAAKAVKLFPIVDQTGTRQKNPNTWWEHHPAAKRDADTKAERLQNQHVPPSTRKEEPVFFAPVIQGMGNFASMVWDSLVAFFTS
jgi:hypothetical protein